MSHPVLDDLDFEQSSILNAIMHPVGADPAGAIEGQVWWRTDLNRMRAQLGGQIRSFAFTSDAGSGSVLAADFNAQTILVAVADDTPLPLTVPASSFVGRGASGDIDALSVGQVLTTLGIDAAAADDQTAAEILALMLTVDGPGSNLDADLLDGQQGSFYATATDLANKADTTYVDAQILSLIAAAPAALDTLNEIATSLANDADFAGTMTTLLSQKAGKFAASIGDGVATTYTVTHSLSTLDVSVQAYVIATTKTAIVTATRPSINTVSIDFKTAPAASSIRILVQG